ncbi:MAG: phosphopantothenoylcysteine decarboxylase / phosphopantothenate---cysteine ligase [Acidobacteriota bacterium]|nr:phosphopantothenoylcysteine decarboxylase / phosphopantothenate---cysteine ligase [Acidobacteriota bacterium]
MNIVLGVTGSISAYKAVDIMRIFQKNNHQVSVIMTRAAQELIPAYTFETFAPGNVFTEMFERRQDPVLHVSICDRNDLLLIAPATANIIGKMANGIADDLLSSTYLAFYKKVVIAPAMNTHMLEHPAVLENIARLKARGVEVIEPVEGSLACKYEGKGKLPAPEDIYNYVVNLKPTHV